MILPFTRKVNTALSFCEAPKAPYLFPQREDPEDPALWHHRGGP